LENDDNAAELTMPVSRKLAPTATTAGIVVALMLLGFGVRLLLGMRAQLDADEATFALAGLHVAHGHFLLMEPNGQYLGALDAYVAAPFVAVLGTNLVAVRLPLALVGALYVLSMYFLARTLFPQRTYAIVTMLVAAIFPLFSVFWGAKMRGGYTELPVFEALCLGLCAKIGWGEGKRLRWWALLGLIAGVALWSDLLFLVVAAMIALGLLIRGPAIGWPAFQRGGALAVGTGVVGLLPWLAFNLPNNLLSLHSIPKNYVGFGTGVKNLLSEHLPILVGGSSSCGHDVVPPIVSDALLSVVVVALLWVRRRTLGHLLAGRFSQFEPLDLVLLILPATFAFLVFSRINYDPCAPRYVMPMTVPLVVGVVTLLTVRWPWRAVSIFVASIWLVVSAIAASGPLVEMQSTTFTGSVIPSDLGPGLAMINREHPGALWADYWLSRPLSYYSGDTLDIAEYGGYVAFAERQQRVQTAARPSWVFVAGDPEISDFERFCARHAVSFMKVQEGGLVLYDRVSTTIAPADVFTGKIAKTN
jgi:4-amino-4-deoxy-L-arabinose transferase-like glycosyltransferase